MSTKKLDLRAQRSRQWLYDALMKLILEKDYNKITVADITDVAGVARPTFYLHYKNKDELLLSSIDQLFDEMYAEFTHSVSMMSAEAGYPVAIFLFEQVAQNPALYRIILSGQGGTPLIQRFEGYVIKLLQHSTEFELVTLQDSQTLKIVARYLLGTTTAILAGWLDDDMQQSPEVMAKLFVDLVRPGLVNVLNPVP